MKIFKRNYSSSLVCFVILSFISFLGGCATFNQSESETPPAPEPINLAQPFSDIPIPKDFERDPSKSFVYESGDKNIKVGRLFFNGFNNLEETVDFYQNEMVNHDWSPGASFLADNGKILNYHKEGWECAIIIQSGWFGSEIEIRIGPK